MDYFISQFCPSSMSPEVTTGNIDSHYYQFLEAYMFFSFGAIAIEISRQALNAFTRKSQESRINSLDAILENIKKDSNDFDIHDLDSSSDEEEITPAPV